MRQPIFRYLTAKADDQKLATNSTSKISSGDMRQCQLELLKFLIMTILCDQ